MKPSGPLRTDPAKQREWERRSRKPLQRSTPLKRSAKPRRQSIEGSDRTRLCERCGADFYDSQFAGMRQRYCSPKCAGEAAKAKAVANYPPKEEIERLYVDEGMSDRDLGRHYGHSYTWALNVRKHYSIPGHPKAHKSRKPLHRKRDRARFEIGLKREPCCRNCGATGLLHLHHAVPRSLSPAGKFDLRNGLPLCMHCHLGWHNGQVAISRSVFTAEEWEFVATLIGPGWLDRRYPEPPSTAPEDRETT